MGRRKGGARERGYREGGGKKLTVAWICQSGTPVSDEGCRLASGMSYSMKPNSKPATRVLVTAVCRFAVSGMKMASSCSVVSTSL